MTTETDWLLEAEAELHPEKSQMYATIAIAQQLKRIADLLEQAQETGLNVYAITREDNYRP